MASHRRPSRDLGPAVRLLRQTAASLKEAQAEELAGIPQNRLSRDENERQLPDLPTLDRLLAYRGVDMERFGLALKEVRGKRETEEPD